jgi:2-polyprenyl-6-methoxyphenol hydroxylase-like FAD-dependent oxidoreductase
MAAFKVIVVGGGPVGLTAAHALAHAGIDFLVLESRDSPVIDAGSNLVIQEEGQRSLSQLGLYDALLEVSTTLADVSRIDHSGRSIGNMQFFQASKKYFGAYPLVVSRHDLTKVLYDNLPAAAQANILTSKRVSDVQATADGASVICKDGSSYAGALVIGADGAHSVIRDRMRALALEAGSAAVNDATPFLTTYRCLWMRFPTADFPNMRPGFVSETHGHDASTQLFVGEETGVTGIYERLEAPTRDRLRFTTADQDALAARWGHIALTEGGTVTFADVYARRQQAGLVSLEEGVVDHWSWGGRVVLVGDAAHKFTPSTGAGCNSGIVDIVALGNELHALFEGRAAGACPSTDEVAVALKAYQDSRYKSTVDGCQFAGGATALSTWASSKLKFMDRHIFPVGVVQKILQKKGAKEKAQVPVFTFIKGKERLVGEMPWAHPIPA